VEKVDGHPVAGDQSGFGDGSGWAESMEAGNTHWALTEAPWNLSRGQAAGLRRSGFA